MTRPPPDAVNSPNPRLLDRLAARDMLIPARPDLDERVTRRFGPLPEAQTDP